ncbi:MAG: hypothetical protein RQ736_03265 [Thiogranum sp.]|nr:hypothetical protein [Thiogranum sp.]
MHQLRLYALPLLTLSFATPVTLFAASPETDQTTLWERTVEESSEAWDKTKDGTAKGAEWTREKSGKALEATREGAGKGAAWTRETSGKAWDATREGASKGAAWMREKTGVEKVETETEESEAVPSEVTP